MIVMGLSGFLTGSTMVAIVTNSFNADAAGVLWTGFAPGVLILLGLGLSGLGLWGRKMIRHGTPVGGPYLALGMREVNLRGASLFQRTEERGANMNKVCVGCSKPSENAPARRSCSETDA